MADSPAELLFEDKRGISLWINMSFEKTNVVVV